MRLRNLVRKWRLGVKAVPFATAPLGSQLLDADLLLPPGWKTVIEIAFPPGNSTPPTDIARRARDAGLICVMRAFDDPTATKRLFAQILPFASAADADEYVRNVDRYRLASPRAQGKPVRQVELDPPAVHAAQRVRAIEIELREGGRDLQMRELICVAGSRVVYLGLLTASPEPMDDLARLADLQVARLSGTTP